MKRSARWWVLFLVPIGLLLVAAFVVEREVGKSKARFEAIKAELVASGEILDVSKIAPERNPESEKKAQALISACKNLASLIESQKVPRLNLSQTPNDRGEIAQIFSRETPLISGDPNSKITWEETEAAYEALALRLQQVRELAKEFEVEIHPAYHQGIRTKVTGMNEIHSAVNPLVADALFALRNRKPERVIDDIETLLSLSRVMGKQRFLISVQVAASIQEQAWKLTWSILGTKVCSSVDLQRLHHIWLQADLLSSIAPALRGERSVSVLVFDSPPEEIFSGVEGDSFNVEALKHAPEPLQYFLWRSFFRYEDASAYLQEYQAIVDAALQSQTSQQWGDLISRFSKAGTLQAYCPVTNLVLRNIADIPTKLILNQALANMALVAISLEQYALAHGSYPETLSELSPEFTAQIPPDPVDNKPLRYKKNSDGLYLLYSVGKNGVDDFGDATASKGSRVILLDRNDLVWPAIAPPKKAISKKPESPTTP